MSMADLLRAFELIDREGSFAAFDGPKDEDLIAGAEKTLGVSFPITYRTFLDQYGCGDLRGEEFYGLMTADHTRSGLPDAVWMTLKSRRRFGLPASLVIVAASANGDYFAVDCAGTSGDGPVVRWVPGKSRVAGELEPVAQDFGEFLRRRVEAVR